MSTKILIVLGADRVGKSTLISKVSDHLEANNLSYKSLHFSGPKPHHQSPICQYLDELTSLHPSLDWVLCDRGGAEVCFYEKIRRNITLDLGWSVKFEEYLKDYYSVVKIVIVKRDWHWSMPKHSDEIYEWFPNCSDYWFMTQMKMRELEHKSYYEFMQHYFSEVSMFKPVVLETNELDSDQIQELLSV